MGHWPKIDSAPALPAPPLRRCMQRLKCVRPTMLTRIILTHMHSGQKTNPSSQCVTVAGFVVVILLPRVAFASLHSPGANHI